MQGHKYSPVIYGPGGVAQVIAPNGLTNAGVTVTAGGSSGLALTANVTPIPFTEVTDLNNLWSGDAFTAPVAAKYRVSGVVSSTASISANIEAYVDGTVKQVVANLSSQSTVPFYADIVLAAGEVLTLRSDTNFTVANTVFRYHNISITAT